MNETFDDIALDSDNADSLNNKSFISNDYSCASKTTVLSVADLTPNHRIKSRPANDDNYLANVSFLLSIFDNIVGPKIVHYWHMEESETILSDYLLKYIAIHTLNGELYLVNSSKNLIFFISTLNLLLFLKDKLINQQKYRMYIIKEIGYCIFSVFFDANTIVTTAAASASSASLASEVDSDEKPQTTLNCLSLILPFNENKPNVLVDHYGDTQFLINSFENMILEYKIYAQIKPKQRKTTSAIQDLTQLIKKFCLNLNMLRLRGIHPISNYSADLKSPNRISVIEHLVFFQRIY